ncbi:MAG: translational GTPase TypA [Candidatus Riflebacteria bacterium]|nr:translational GTPase TypA [Candidatus Riflebacteria bacterium]
MTDPISRDKRNDQIRNIAIIAHVDHGKTTLVDGLLKQTGHWKLFEKGAECILDSNPLERERGITILAKNTSIRYKDYKINVVDTPGHADFGGEVERVLRMVDGCLLVVDAFEGPMPQTRFVLRKALELSLCPVVIVNKIDRPGIDIHDVLDRCYDLFIELHASEEQLDFPVLYASGKLGFAVRNFDGDERRDFAPLLDAILEHVPAPPGDTESPFQLLVTTIDYDPFIKRIAIGRIQRGTIETGATVKVFDHDGILRTGAITQLMAFEDMNRVKVARAEAGDIVAMAGIEDIQIGETIADATTPEQLDPLHIDRPTLSMTFGPNTSPFSGREGQYVTSRKLRERLFKEIESNVALRVEEIPDSRECLKVSGRGELHISILIETMRREGYEMEVSRPEVIMREVDGVLCEPYEYLVITVPEEFTGIVMQKIGERRGLLRNMLLDEDGINQRIEFDIPTRGLLGYRNELLTDTRGTGVMNHAFNDYRPATGGSLTGRSRGVLIAKETGPTTSWALDNLQSRGELFVGPSEPVYAGQIVGENSRENDLVINPTKRKHLTNIRSSTAEDAIRLTSPRIFTLEQALEYIEDDELAEITPQSIRLRKRLLDHTVRKRLSRKETKEPAD